MAALFICGPQQSRSPPVNTILQHWTSFPGMQTVSHLALALASILYSISESPIGYPALAFMLTLSWPLCGQVLMLLACTELSKMALLMFPRCKSCGGGRV